MYFPFSNLHFPINLQLSKFRIKHWKLLSIIIISLLISIFALSTSFAEPNCDSPGPGDIDYCLAKLEEIIGALEPAQEYNKKELADLKVQTASLEKQIKGISYQLELTHQNIQDREEDLEFTQLIFEEKTTSHYKFIRLYDPISPFLSSNQASLAFREIVYRTKAANQDIGTMEDLANDLYDLKNDKEKFEKNKSNLAAIKERVNQRAEFLASEVEKTQKVLASLSARQEELIALKAGGFQTSVGDTPPTLEPCSGPPGSSNFCDPGFKPAFAAFSFGAPHRTGMSQYGAYGRSKQGQSAETILASYYQSAELSKGYPVPDTIGVTGHGRIPFEDNYLLGIYEVPESWGDKGGFEALKAQAVAARSYALAVTGGGGGNICATEACQVYKPQLKSGKWAEAVRATRGWVITKGGSPATTYYASTSGGFTINKWGWTGIKDAKDGDWPNQAYEKIASSPWFYKGWYKTRSGTSCGRNNPWLTSSEMADILNARYVLDGKGGDSSRISPVDTSCWGGNPYSQNELSSIGGFNSVSGVSVIYGNDGSTNTVTFQTNKGTQVVSGSKFKEAFNLRAPGYVGLKSSLFNIEKL
jgi:peptidoglycan hydrolase CwlO-like protein